MERCQACNKKLGLFEYKCKCGKKFCISHLQAEFHQCTFDYKLEGKEKLRKENEIVIAQKLEKL